MRPDDEYAVRADGTLVLENAVEGEADINIQTAVLQLGPQGTLKRVREVQLRQPKQFSEVSVYLVATDPEREYLKIDEATLNAENLQKGLNPNVGLGPDIVIDVRGTGKTGQSIESMFVEWDVRNRRIRDHQPHQYPAYLDSPEVDQTSKNSDDSTFVLTNTTDV
jgi:hypothetical protein